MVILATAEMHYVYSIVACDYGFLASDFDVTGWICCSLAQLLGLIGTKPTESTLFEMTMLVENESV